MNKTGNYNVNFLVGLGLLAIGSGLFTTFTPTSSNKYWIPYQLLHGIGAGLTLAVPPVAIQAELASTPQKIPLGISVVMFFEYFGLAVYLSFALTIFQNRLLDELGVGVGLTETQVNALFVGGTGQVRRITTMMFPDKLEHIINVYNDAITTVFVSLTTHPGIGSERLTRNIIVFVRRQCRSRFLPRLRDILEEHAAKCSTTTQRR